MSKKIIYLVTVVGLSAFLGGCELMGNCSSELRETQADPTNQAKKDAYNRCISAAATVGLGQAQ